MRKAAVLVAVLLLSWGCATLNRSYKRGTEAALNKDWDEAVRLYERATLQDPRNPVYRLALMRAKAAATFAHLAEARRLASQGQRDKALDEYKKALSFDPFNWRIIQEARRLQEGKPEEKRLRGEKIELPVKLQVSDEKMHLKFTREASLRSIFEAMAKHAKINIIFDEQFRDKPFAIDLTDMNFEQALNTLCVASKNFYRIIDERTLIIIPDQPMNRTKYEITAIKTFYLSNIDAQEIQGALTQMLRTPLKAPSLIPHKELNAITVRDVPEVLELADKIIRLWDKPRGEVVIDLEIMEVSRIRLREMGIDLDQHGVSFRYLGVEESGWYNLSDIDFSKAENFQLTLPTGFIDLIESDSDTKLIAQPRLRGVDGEKIEYKVADEIPIPRTTFTPIAAGGVSQQPIVNYDYKPVGIEVNITPTIHFENEITLELDIKIKSLGGTGYADLPIISTRDVKGIIRLRDGETNLLAGLLKDEERVSLKGIVGLKSIPIIGRLFSHTEQTVQQTDVILTITPYIIRTMPFTDEDAKPLWVDLEGTTAGVSAGEAVLPEEEYRAARERALQERMRAAAEAGANEISLAPSNFEVPEGREFRINVNLRSEAEIANMSLNIGFTAGVLDMKEIIMGGFVRQFGDEVSFLKNIDSASGVATIGFSSPDVSRGFKGAGGIATLVFAAAGKGESSVTITGVAANSPTGDAIQFETQDARVRVR